MKIKITENQYSKIRVIAEQEEYVTKYQDFCTQKIEEIDRIYSTVINQSVADIIDMDINAAEMVKRLEKIETDVNKAEQNMTSLWDNKAIGGDDENFDLKIGELASSVTDKITSLTLILNPLEELQRLQSEYKLNKNFGNVKPISI